MTQHERTAVAPLDRPTSGVGPETGPDTWSESVRVPIVAWRHVLVTAAVLSLGNTYWAVLLRDVSGPVARTDASLVWLRDSAVMLPCYVVAVLAAVTLVHGRRARAGRVGDPRLLPLGVAVAGTGALVGVASLVAITSHHTAGAVPVGSVVRGSLLVVATDAVLVGLLAAFDGRRLPLAVDVPVPSTGIGREPADQLAAMLAATLVGSAAVHAAVIPEHVGHWALQTEFFWLLVTAQSVAGVLVLRVQRTGLLLAVAVVSLASAVVWAVSRTSGLPFGPEAWQAQAVGVADVAATTLELASFGLAMTLLSRRTSLRRGAPADIRALGLAAVAAVTVIGVAGTTLPVVGAFPPPTPVHGAGDHRAPGS